MSLADAGAVARSDLVMVRPMATDDAAFAADLHAEALGHGFFGRLGTGFLTAYYQSFVVSPHAVALVAETDHGLAGFLVGTLCNSPHYSWVLRSHGLRLALRGVLALLTRPAQLAFFARTRARRYFTRAARVSRQHVTPAGRAVTDGASGHQPSGRRVQPAVLTHLAVTSTARGLGVGGALEQAFIAAARARGCRQAVLVTLAGDAGAGAFYRRLGWTLSDRRNDRDGRPIECYRRRL